MSLCVAILLCSIFVFSFAGEAAEFTNECLKENDLAEKDIKMFDSVEDIPENVLCFTKCMNIKSGVLQEDGTIVIDNINIIPGVDKLKEPKLGQLTECIKEIGKVEECSDM
ncbi:unnamed protein product, partial [Tenebrio molitor]